MNEAAPRFNVLGIGVHAINMASAIAAIDNAIRSMQKGYICVTGVHGVMEAQSDSSFGTILNHSFLTTPDGMPLVWIGRLQGFRSVGRVYGPDLMLEVCRLSAKRGYSHFLYGGQPGVAEQLAVRLPEMFPGLKIAGTLTPPFRPLNAEEDRELARLVSGSKPDFFWVGLSTPKQERFMAAYLEKLEVKLMAGVGAAFDIHTGRIKDSPPWIKNAGLQWSHRLLQEPRRLWRRYLINNPIFVFKITMQMLGIKKYNML